MRINQVLEARHISHNHWDMFRQEFMSKPYPERTKEYLKDPRMPQFFKEMKWSFDWWYEMCKTYMEEEPEGYDPVDLEPESIVDQWVQNVVDDPGEGGALMDLDVFPELRRDVEYGHMTTITLAIARWVKKHVQELVNED